MCYINGVRVSLETYIAYKQQQKELKQLMAAKLLYQPAKRGFDYSEWPVIKPSADGKDWDVVGMEWGFLPNHVRNAEEVKKFRFGYKDEKGVFRTPYTTLNAIGEEMLQPGKMFRQAALASRCLVLSSGFFEHRHVEQIGKKGLPLKTPAKFPYHITVPGKEYFMMAGIYNTWTDKDTGETKDTFAIVTTKANKLMSQVHNSKMRMPAILTDELADEWTNPNLSEDRIKEIASFQYPSEALDAWPVTKEFLAQAEPAEPFAYESLLALEK